MDHEENCGCHHSAHSQVTQTLSELDFERGIWTAGKIDGINSSQVYSETLSSVIYNERDRVKEFVVKGHVNSRDNSGYTALHYAARNGDLGICRLLVDHDADVNVRTNGGATPLHRAAMMGHLEVVKLLLDAGADIQIQDEDGQTVLHRSAAKGDFLVSQCLIKNCSSLTAIKDKKGRIPYDLISTGNEQLQKLLLPPE